MPTKKTAPRKRATSPKPGANGLRRFHMHALDTKSQEMITALSAERPQWAGFASAPSPVASMDAESAARLYLKQALESSSVPELTAPVADGVESEFRSLGTEYVPLTETTMVRFRQHLNRIPVYGSLVTVELDEGNELLGVDYASGLPANVDSVAKISPAEALKAIEKKPGFAKTVTGITPQLHYYYDSGKKKWRLAYIAQDVPVQRKGAKAAAHTPLKMDYVVDAHSGAIVAEKPRTALMAAVAETASDELGKPRNFTADQNGTAKTMFNSTLNVRTFDFQFRDPESAFASLPGRAVTNPPAWSGGAVSAHANAEEVALFLKNTLRRNGLDNRGGPFVSTINCVVVRESLAPREWINAAWIGNQMIYGQRRNGTSLLSLSSNLDTVAHEMFHGVTDFTSRLEYQDESGALNESYSDIFGILVSNFKNPDVNTWDFELGEGLTAGGTPFRDLRQPERFNQPSHMRDFVVTSRDHGGVHTNSGIHNHAAFRIMTAKDASGAIVLQPAETAAIFYIALTQRLSRTSVFSDSRRAVIASARTLFRNLPAGEQSVKISATEKGFTAVGIL